MVEQLHRPGARTSPDHHPRRGRKRPRRRPRSMLRTRPWVPYLYVRAGSSRCSRLVFALPGRARRRLLDAADPRRAAGPFVGSLNYQLVCDDPTFREALKHSALLLLARARAAGDLDLLRGAPVRASCAAGGSTAACCSSRTSSRSRSSASSPATCSSSTARQQHARARSGSTGSRSTGSGSEQLVAADRRDRDRLARGRLRDHPLPRAAADAATRSSSRPPASTARAGGSGCAT